MMVLISCIVESVEVQCKHCTRLYVGTSVSSANS